eukprot:TRINITY_DN66170_c12_g5_i1.p1 TRINITY_DN66170_c12_g5~~TRINITY_DN66170_c12_g5_i1.p1  ORF type:complete len:723 (+),score=342.15 TRINITY_DN66170_c12_g5_i1:26-2170(+)
MGSCVSGSRPPKHHCREVPPGNVYASLWTLFAKQEVLGTGGYCEVLRVTTRYDPQSGRLKPRYVHPNLRAQPPVNGDDHGGGGGGGERKQDNVRMEPHVEISKSLRSSAETEFACKQIRKRDLFTDESNEKRFMIEVRLLRSLQHTHIVRYVDCFEDRENYYLLTEVCGGGSLFDRIKDMSEYSEADLSRIIREALSAIEYCHRHNVVHRDIKPENFVYKGTSKYSELKLIDFGEARRVQDDRVYKSIAGTPYYVAPEMVDRKTERTGKILKASDMWSLGVVAFVLGTGAPPFPGRKNQEIFDRIVNEEPNWDNPGCKYLSASLMDFIRKLLVKDPMKRMTVNEAIRHPWVASFVSPEVSISTANPGFKDVLRTFIAECQLKKAIALLVLDQLSHDELARFRKHFDRVDANGDGLVEKSELVAVMVGMGQDIYHAEDMAERVIFAADQDGDGKVSFREFCEFHTKRRLTMSQDGVRLVFNNIDSNSDGFIDRDELGVIFSMYSDEQIDAMMLEVDHDGDGLISFDEFVDAMQLTAVQSVRVPSFVRSMNDTVDKGIARVGSATLLDTDSPASNTTKGSSSALLGSPQHNTAGSSSTPTAAASRVRTIKPKATTPSDDEKDVDDDNNDDYSVIRPVVQVTSVAGGDDDTKDGNSASDQDSDEQRDANRPAASPDHIDMSFEHGRSGIRPPGAAHGHSKSKGSQFKIDELQGITFL